MSKSQVLIVTGLLLLLVGSLFAVSIVVRYAPFLDGDSVGPDIVALILTFTIRDYWEVFLIAGLFISGLFIFLTGFVLNLRKKYQRLAVENAES